MSRKTNASFTAPFAVIFFIGIVTGGYKIYKSLDIKKIINKDGSVSFSIKSKPMPENIKNNQTEIKKICEKINKDSETRVYVEEKFIVCVAPRNMRFFKNQCNRGSDRGVISQGYCVYQRDDKIPGLEEYETILIRKIRNIKKEEYKNTITRFNLGPVYHKIK
jgi:hypothetical protein